MTHTDTRTTSQASLSTNPSTDSLARGAPSPDAPLSEIQEWMAALIRHRRGLPRSTALCDAARRHFSGNDRLSPAEQIEIYRQQFWLRHTSSLVEDFPGLTGLLGQKAWEPIAESYLVGRGFDIFALKDLGKHMAEHLKSVSADVFEEAKVDRQLLVDMAHLESAYVRAFDLIDDPRLQAHKLAQIPPQSWEQARFSISPSVTLLRLTYPVAEMRRKLKEDPGGVDAHAAIKDPHQLVVYRRDRTLWDKRISLPAFLLLEQFQKGTPLVAACEAAILKDPSAEAVFEQQLAEWFALWGRLGWIVDVTCSELTANQNTSNG